MSRECPSRCMAVGGEQAMTAQGKAAFRLSDTPGWCDTELELASGLRGRRKEKEEKERPRGLPGPPQRALDTHGEDPGISWLHLADPRWIGTSLPHGSGRRAAHR